MLTLKDFMELVNYRITEGSAYGWQCYGYNAYSLDSWNGIHDEGGHSASVVFDTVDQTVYEMTVCDYTNCRAYRWQNPDVVDVYKQECQQRGIDDAAWDDVDWISLETTEDFLDKAAAIIEGRDYDARIEVPLELPDEMVTKLMMMAHNQDITLNQLVGNLLTEFIDVNKKKDVV